MSYIIVAAVLFASLTIDPARAAAQVFTPTRVPQTIVVPAKDLLPAQLLTQDRCNHDETQRAEQILDALRAESSTIRRLFDQAAERKTAQERSTTPIAGVNRRLRDLHGSIREAIVDLSVADRRPKWTAAIVKAQSAARALAGDAAAISSAAAFNPVRYPVIWPQQFFDEAEAASIEQSRRATSCAADELGKRAASGPPDGFGIPKKAFFLPGAGFSTGNDSTDVNLKAAEFFFSNHWRLYVHSTVTLEQAEPEATDPTEEVDAAAEAEAAPDINAMSESVKSALLNPYGSPLYLTAGYLRKIRTPFFDGDANDGNHGLFIDSRLGLKFMPLPEEGLELVDGKSTNTAFYVASAALRLRLPLYNEAPFVAGEDGIDVAITGVLNRVSRRGASTLFALGADETDPLVPPTLAAANLEIGVSLPKLANVVISGTLWSNSKFDRRFQLSINLQKSDTEIPKPEPAQK